MDIIFHRYFFVGHRLILMLVIVFYFSVSQAQTWGDIVGARSVGMGECSVALEDFWSLNNNPAGIADFKNLQTGINYSNRFLMKELSTKSIAGLFPVYHGVMAVSMQYYGYSMYREMTTSLVYGIRLTQKIVTGVQLQYINVAYGEGYGSRNHLTFGIGLQYNLTENMNLGVYIYNPVKERLGIDVPFIFKMGMAYSFSKQLLTTLETEKNSFLPIWNLRAGIDYKPNKSFSFQTGLELVKEVFSFGFGYRWKNCMIHLSSLVNEQIGLSPQISVIYTYQ